MPERCSRLFNYKRGRKDRVIVDRDDKVRASEMRCTIALNDVAERIIGSIEAHLWKLGAHHVRCSICRAVVNYKHLGQHSLLERGANCASQIRLAILGDN